jgi:hypothetical protein
MAVRFPSTEFFNALKDQMAAEQARFRRLGFIDTTFGIGVAHNGASRNFVREMLESIKRHGEADTAHDLNTLAHFGEALKVSYVDPEGHDKLYRFMESIQEFFDLSSKVDVTF